MSASERSEHGVTRREAVSRAVAGAATTVLGGGLLGTGLSRPSAAAAAARPIVPLPTAETMRAGIQKMVDFGPRLPGYVEHDHFCDYLENELVTAGLDLIPCDEYIYNRWRPESFSLDVLGGSSPGPVKIATTWVRSADTGPDGLTGPLVYGGALPAPTTSTTNTAADLSGAQAYPAQVESAIGALPGGLSGSLEGSILLVDVPIPAPLTAGIFAGIASYLQWDGHSVADFAQIDYRRAWLGPFPDLASFAGLGVKGVIFILDASYEALVGEYSPHTGPRQPLPAFLVDRDTGKALRAQAAARPQARMVLSAPSQKVPVRSITAVLPGQSKSDEVIIIDTHSDGQNAIEENAGIGLLALARHFASLPPAQAPQRTLVFAAWPGHMTSDLPQAFGWIRRHPDLVKRAVGAVTMEHLGCTEWLDTADEGFRPTGENEVYGIWTTQGPMQKLNQDALRASNLQRHALLKPPVEVTPGAPFHTAGIPHVAGIAGPVYLLNVADNGHIDKLDSALAAQQVAFYADVVRRIDRADAAALKTGDPTLGQPTSVSDAGPYESTLVDCGPAQVIATPKGLSVRFYGNRRQRHGVLVTVATGGPKISGLTVELRRGSTLYARSAKGPATAKIREIILRRKHNKRFTAGNYTLVVRANGKVLQRRTVRVRVAKTA